MTRQLLAFALLGAVVIGSLTPPVRAASHELTISGTRFQLDGKPFAYTGVSFFNALDARRLVTSSPGFAGVLGPKDLNEALDYLTPHTSRQNKGRTGELAPKEIASLRLPIVPLTGLWWRLRNQGSPLPALTPSWPR